MRKRLLLFFCCIATGLIAQIPAPPPEIHDFDIWLGAWEVTQPAGKVAVKRVIESILEGRVIEESYQTAGRYRGHSFNIYIAPAKG
jgi:hypothetical protein